MDIVFMFWAIAVGIVVGAGFYTLGIIGSIVVGIIILVFSGNVTEDTPYLFIIHFEDEADEEFFMEEVSESRLTEALIEEFSTKELSEFVTSVEALITEGILKGNGDKLYPLRDVTRAEFVALICRSAEFDLDEDASAFFTDVPSTHFVFDCLSKLVDKEITKGYGDGTFRPDDTVTRGGALTMLSRAFNLDLPEEYTNNYFKDVNEDYALWMYANSVYTQGWLSGEYLRPNDNLKRAEAFDWIARFIGHDRYDTPIILKFSHTYKGVPGGFYT
jgi:hypothetical protein